MKSTPSLPDPWRYDNLVEGALFDALELHVGSGMTPKDLEPEEIAGDGTPQTRRAERVLGRRWVQVSNVDTDVVVLLRLQRDNATRSVRISSVIYPFSPDHEIVGGDLRGLPVAAMNAAFTTYDNEGPARLMRAIVLGDAIKTLDPLAKLPGANADDEFAARVAMQFMAVEEAFPEENTAKKMAALNERPVPTIQTWLARARKRGLLAPATPKGHR